MRVLITGVAGSVGSYMAERLAGFDEVHGFARWRTGVEARRISQVLYHEVDLMDLGSVIRAVERIEPEVVFHFAAHANVKASFDTPLAVLENNIRGTANLVEALRIAYLPKKFVLGSSSEVYGRRAGWIDEADPIQPVNPYAASKAAQEAICRAYAESFGLKLIITRAFSYINPRRKDLFSSHFARQIVRIERGLQTELRHGNLQSTRSFLDISDMIAAYRYSLDCRVGEVYNIGSELEARVEDVLAILVDKAEVEIPCRSDPSLFRPVDLDHQVPNVNKFHRETSWRAYISLEQSLQWLLDYYRELPSEML